MEEFLHKVIVIGSPGVGKTSLLERYVNNSFVSDYKPTLGGWLSTLCPLNILLFKVFVTQRLKTLK